MDQCLEFGYCHVELQGAPLCHKLSCDLTTVWSFGLYKNVFQYKISE